MVFHFVVVEPFLVDAAVRANKLLYWLFLWLILWIWLTFLYLWFLNLGINHSRHSRHHRRHHWRLQKCLDTVLRIFIQQLVLIRTESNTFLIADIERIAHQVAILALCRLCHSKNPNFVSFLLIIIWMAHDHQNVVFFIRKSVLQLENQRVFIPEVQELPSQRLKIHVKLKSVGIQYHRVFWCPVCHIFPPLTLIIMRQIIEVHDLDPQLGLLGILKVSEVVDFKFHSNKLSLFLFLIVEGLELAMKVSLGMVFFAKPVVKGPVDRKEVMSEVTFVAEEFLVLTGGMERFQAFLTLWKELWALIITHATELPFEGDDCDVFVWFEHLQDFVRFQLPVFLLHFLDETYWRPYFEFEVHNIMKDEYSQYKRDRVFIGSNLDMLVNVMGNMLAYQKIEPLPMNNLLLFYPWNRIQNYQWLRLSFLFRSQFCLLVFISHFRTVSSWNRWSWSNGLAQFIEGLIGALDKN